MDKHLSVSIIEMLKQNSWWGCIKERIGRIGRSSKDFNDGWGRKKTRIWRRGRNAQESYGDELKRGRGKSCEAEDYLRGTRKNYQICWIRIH